MKTRQIFIVDDDDSVRLSLVQLLSILPDHQVHSFASGDVFLAAAARLDPGCLLLDLHMPGTPGIGVLEAIGPIAERFATIVLTGESDVGTAVQAMKLGAFDFLEKPCDHVRLIAAIESAFSRQAKSIQAVTRRAQALAKINSLSLRERDVLIGLIEGHSNKVIAHDLGISPRTIEIYRAKLMEKLHVRSLSEALGIAFAAGLYSND
ncbi:MULTISPECIES: response regulator transcription factor [unclassified Sphingobium]|uniref:response regulator transcription factor n=1 Tax=unclassified Sphingobium TaxID=2611147 RepID=UPI0007F50D7B|nr:MULTISPECIES: response regulator [unclassified Sphingobium]OAN52590.1 DNA-binding response regulator [Sphingobium sp. TCM1]WIW90909.1 response regulator [Sphingobium sp. V4]